MVNISPLNKCQLIYSMHITAGWVKSLRNRLDVKYWYVKQPYAIPPLYADKSCRDNLVVINDLLQLNKMDVVWKQYCMSYGMCIWFPWKPTLSSPNISKLIIKLFHDLWLWKKLLSISTWWCINELNHTRYRYNYKKSTMKI